MLPTPLGAGFAQVEIRTNAWKNLDRSTAVALVMPKRAAKAALAAALVG